MTGLSGGRLRVVVADDDPRVREDFRVLLELEDDIVVVGEAADGRAAVAVARRELPDVVVMDVRMPLMDGIEATGLLRQGSGDACRVLVVTTFDLDDYVLGAVRAGAGGFLLKDQAPDRLAEAVRIVAGGEGIVSPRATARLLREFVPAEPAISAAAAALTERERDLVRLVARGLGNDAIAAEAHITRATVKTHVSNVLAKLALSSRMEIVVWAYENGLAAVPRGTR